MSVKNNTMGVMKIGVIGAGYWGKNLVRVLYEAGMLYKVADASQEILTELKQNYPRILVSENEHFILEDSAITGVIIATPAVYHFEMVKKALKAGKHVFVEKPLALNATEGAELVKLAREMKRILFVGHILHYHPCVIKMKEMIRQGIIGRIEYIYSNRLSLGKIRREENILWSFAPHDISLILDLAGEDPHIVEATGSNFLHPSIADVTMSCFKFPNGISAHIFVSWLNPFKEQRLVVVGSQGMMVFEDTLPLEQKLVLYPHVIQWKNGAPLPQKAQAVQVKPDGEFVEPLKNEINAFMDCMREQKEPITSGIEGLRVLKVLEQCQAKIESSQIQTKVLSDPETQSYFKHESAYVDEGAEIGPGTKIWHFSHVLKNAVIGKNCVIGQNVNIDGGVIIGNQVKIQNNVSVYTGLVIEDEVFLGPSCVLTNVSNPRSQINRHSLYEKTLIRRGATVGANATVVCGIEIGRYAFIGAGAVVTKSVPDYGLVVGNPARQIGWMSRHGHVLKKSKKGYICPESGYRYVLSKNRMTCLDLDEEKPLPGEHKTGKKSYREFKNSPAKVK